MKSVSWASAFCVFFLALVFSGCSQKKDLAPEIKSEPIVKIEQKKEITELFYKRLKIKPVVKKVEKEKALFEHGYEFFKKENENEK